MIEIALGIILAVILLSTIEYWLPFLWVVFKALLGGIALLFIFVFLWAFLGVLAGV